MHRSLNDSFCYAKKLNIGIPSSQDPTSLLHLLGFLLCDGEDGRKSVLHTTHALCLRDIQQRIPSRTRTDQVHTRKPEDFRSPEQASRDSRSSQQKFGTSGMAPSLRTTWSQSQDWIVLRLLPHKMGVCLPQAGRRSHDVLQATILHGFALRFRAELTSTLPRGSARQSPMPVARADRDFKPQPL